MKTRYKVLQAKNIIVVDADGRLDLEGSKEAIRQIASDSEYREDYCMVMDLRGAECDLSSTDIVELAAFMAWPDPALPTRRRIAVLVTHNDAWRLASFMETCARNRGLPIKAFTSVEEAEAWLDVEIDD